MKKMWFYFGLLAVAVLLFACQKETNSEDVTAAPSEEQTTDPAVQDLDPDKYLVAFSARIEQVGTRVSIDVTEGALSFEEGDEVLVVTESGETGIYVYNSDAVFAPKDAENAVSAVAAKAYYPAGEFAVSGSDVTFTLPTAISAGSAEDLGDKLPMAAVVTSNEVAQFKVLGSVLRARFNSAFEDGETITDLELTVAGANITGSGTVSWTEDVPSVASLDGTTSIKIGTANGHLTHAGYKEFYFFLPASGTLTSMTLKAIYGKADGYEPYETISRTSAMALAGNKIFKVEKSLSGFFSGGDGSEAHPYLIASADDFKAISTLANATEAAEADKHGNGYLAATSRTFFGTTGVHYLQTADIDFKNADLSAYMIGGASTPFTGTYNGKPESTQYTLSNFTISGTPSGNEGVAPFKAIDGAVLQNIAISNATVSGGKFTAGLVGYAKGAGTTVQNCSISNSTIEDNGHDYGAGGLIGGIYGGTVSRCSGTDMIISTSGDKKEFFGGIICYINGDVTVSECVLNGTTTVTKATKFGGIVGSIANVNVEITNCHNHSTINASTNYMGGICGNLKLGTISACTNDGEINAGSSAAGIVATLAGDTVDDAMVIGCVNTGNINAANSYAGGVVAFITKGHVKNSRSEATVIAAADHAGGLIGAISGTGGTRVNSCFAKGNVKGSSNVGGFIGNMQAGSAYIVNSLAACNVVATAKDNNQAAGGFVGRIQNSENGKNVWIGNCAVYDVIVKAINQTSNTKPVRVGGFAGVHNFTTTRSNSMIQNCYYQGVAENLGYGGGDDFTTKPTTINGGYHGGIAGYSAGHLLDCYSTPKVKANGSGGTYTNNTTLSQEFIYGNTNSNPAITTSTSIDIAANTTTLGGVLSAVDATFSGMDFSDWDSYEEGGKYYYYPASLTSLGEEFYKK